MSPKHEIGVTMGEIKNNRNLQTMLFKKVKIDLKVKLNFNNRLHCLKQLNQYRSFIEDKARYI